MTNKENITVREGSMRIHSGNEMMDARVACEIAEIIFKTNEILDYMDAEKNNDLPKEVLDQQIENYVDTASNQTIGSDEYKGLDPNTKCRYNAIDVENTSGKILGYRILKNHMCRDDDTQSPNLDIKTKSPKWLRNLWRGTQFNQKTHDTTIAELEKDNVCMAGDGSVRDQLGAHAWCLAQKERDEPFFQTSSPVDGSRECQDR